jgi:hypothetical protein
MANSSLKALNIAGESKDPVKSLWRNVLIVALEDAIGKGFRCYGMSDRNYIIQLVHTLQNLTQILRRCVRLPALIMNI